jgi:hypothetical protein
MESYGLEAGRSGERGWTSTQSTLARPADQRSPGPPLAPSPSLGLRENAAPLPGQPLGLRSEPLGGAERRPVLGSSFAFAERGLSLPVVGREVRKRAAPRARIR